MPSIFALPFSSADTMSLRFGVAFIINGLRDLDRPGYFFSVSFTPRSRSSY